MEQVTPENQFEEFEEVQDFSRLDATNLLFEIWVKPKLVFDYIFKYDKNKYLDILLIVASFVATFQRVLDKGIEVNSASILISILGILFGTLVTYGCYFLFAWFLRVIGTHLFNGKAKNKDYLIVIAWSNIPMISSIILTFLIIVLYGINAASDYYSPSNSIDQIVIIGFTILDAILALWSLAIMVVGVMKIQNFNVWKALGNVLLPFAVFVSFVLILALMLGTNLNF